MKNDTLGLLAKAEAERDKATFNRLKSLNREESIETLCNLVKQFVDYQYERVVSNPLDQCPLTIIATGKDIATFEVLINNITKRDK